MIACDICGTTINSPDECMVYPCRDFLALSINNEDGKTLHQRMTGDWALCLHHHDIIQKYPQHQRCVSALVDDQRARLTRKFGPQGTWALHTQLLLVGGMWGGFLRHRSGVPYRPNEQKWQDLSASYEEGKEELAAALKWLDDNA